MTNQSNQTEQLGQHTTMTTNGIQLHVVQAGPETGPLVILLHGFPEFWYGWHKQIPALVAAGYRVWVPDQRGYNLSDKPKDVASYAIGELAADIIGLIDAANVEKVYLVGHDWGAGVAWWMGINFPDRLHKLIILNVPHLSVMLDYVRRSLSQLRKSWYMVFFQIPWLPEFLLRLSNWHGLAQTMTQSGQAGTFSPDDLALYRRAWSQPGALTGMLNWYRTLMRYRPNLTDQDRVSTQTLIIWGKQDSFLSYEMAELSVRKCDNGRLVTIPDATHWVQHEAAEQVNELIVSFLK